MLYFQSVSLLSGKPFIQRIGERDRPVLSSGAANGDYKLVLPFCNIIRNQEVQHMGVDSLREIALGSVMGSCGFDGGGAF